MNKRDLRIPGLLVSIRNAEEADAALRGGADVIDVKEPSRGSLGAASAEVMTAAVNLVAGRRPVSAAFGELLDSAGDLVVPPGLSWIKFGLAGMRHNSHWPERFQQLRQRVEAETNARFVAVAYADWQRVAAPPVGTVAALARRLRVGAFLIDTCIKDGLNLLHWLPRCAIEDLILPLRDAGIAVALAGSLGPTEMQALVPVRPNWFAVRGSVCRGGRGGQVCSEQVGRIAAMLRGE